LVLVVWVGMLGLSEGLMSVKLKLNLGVSVLMTWNAKN